MKAEDVMKALEWYALVSVKIGSATVPCDELNGVLSLLREKDAVIERLTRICDSYTLQYGTAVDKEAFLKQERADTVRTMQERLSKKAYTNNYCQEIVLLSDIDQIAKEMLEANE